MSENDLREFDEQTQKIARLNDALRTTFNPAAGVVVVTPGFRDLAPEDAREIVKLVQTFNAFSDDDDPYGQHDFGVVKFNGERVYWKVDYYDPSMTKGSEDPSDITQTKRVMTLMMANEY